MVLRASNLPRHVGNCRCGKRRGHDGLCFGEQPAVAVIFKSTRTPWHDMRDSFVEEFGDRMGNWLARRVGSHVKDYTDDCMDNFSIVELPTGLSRLSPAAHEAVGRHKERRAHGCCGSVDVELHHYSSGRKFTFGFNHGH